MAATNGAVVHVGLVQMRCTPDPEENLERAIDLVGQAAEQGADVVCLPELFQAHYFCKTESTEPFDLAEPIPGPTTKRLEAVARDHGVVLIASLFEKRAEGLYHNTAALLNGAEGYAGKYRKMHIPDDPLYYEKYYFTPGDLGFKSFETAHGRVGVLICWDQWYPEAARLTALTGADYLFYPTAIGWHPSEKAAYGHAQHNAWETVQRGHAVANGCYVVAVNRTGFEPTPGATDPEDGIEFWGQSFVAGPDGTILAKAPVDQESVMVVPLDRRKIRDQRHGWPFLRDRRIDAYDQLTRRFIDAE